MTKDDLLLDMCKRTAVVPMGYDPNIYSIPHLAEIHHTSKYHIRKLMKELEADGAVHRSYVGDVDDDGYPHCYHGWSITEKTCDSELYKKCEKEAIAEFERFNREFDEEWERQEMLDNAKGLKELQCDPCEPTSPECDACEFGGADNAE